MRFAAAVDRAVAATLVALMAVAVVNVLWQVASRFLLGDPSSFTDELARYLLVWIGLLGAAHAAGRRRHLAIDLLPARLAARGRALVGMGVEAMVFCFAAGVLVAGGARLVQQMISFGQRTAALEIPLGWIYGVLPLSGLLVMFHSARFAREHLRVWRREEGA